MVRFEIGDRVLITGGVSDKGASGEVSEVAGDFVGVRIPTISDARETVYVTLGSVTRPPDASITHDDLNGSCPEIPNITAVNSDINLRTPETQKARPSRS
jgi:hypothetical protein